MSACRKVIVLRLVAKNIISLLLSFELLEIKKALNKDDKKLVNKVAWMFFKALKQHIF